MWYKKKKKINWKTETPEEFLARGGKVNHIKKDNRKFLSPEDRENYEYMSKIKSESQKKNVSEFDKNLNMLMFDWDIKMDRHTPGFNPKNVPWDIRSKFYDKKEWKSLRDEFIESKSSEELVCTQCNKGPFTKENWSDMNVDHIKPVKHFWEERLNISNLQILCSICNRVKLNYYKENTDIRYTNMKKKVQY